MVKIEILSVLFFVQIIKCQDDRCVNKDDNFEQHILKYQIDIPNPTLREKYEQQFYKTKQEIEEFNARPENTYTQALNKFSHLSTDEVMKTSFGLSLMSKTIPLNHERIFDLICEPRPIDWSKVKRAVSPVKDQGTCGICYIFAAVAAIETLTFIKTNVSYVLSEQYAMDCMSKYLKVQNNACLGGQPQYTYDLAIYRRGLAKEQFYPYRNMDLRMCPIIPLVRDAAIRSYKTLTTNNENTIACLLADGPLTVAMYVNATFLRYSGGIYNDVASCGPNMVLNHAAVLVGYGIDRKTNMEYFIFKNSWGTDFGEKGYFRMQKGINLCGIANLVQQPSFDDYDLGIK